MTTLPPKTRAEIDALKASWREDPSWDLEETEGFEAHKAELLRYRVEVEAERDRQASKRQAEVRKLEQPARDMLGTVATTSVGLSHGALYIVMRIAAEMLLPLQRQLERQAEDIEAMQRRHKDEIDALRRQLVDL